MRSQQAEQEHATTGQHFNPWQKAVKLDGTEVWIVRQDGDGKQAWLYTSAGEKLSPDQAKYI